MKLKQKTSKTPLSIALQISDYISELELLIEKISILTDDISSNCLEKINLKTERGNLTAEYDLKIAKIKADMISTYTMPAARIIQDLLPLSDEIVCQIKNMHLQKCLTFGVHIKMHHPFFVNREEQAPPLYVFKINTLFLLPMILMCRRCF